MLQFEGGEISFSNDGLSSNLELPAGRVSPTVVEVSKLQHGEIPMEKSSRVGDTAAKSVEILKTFAHKTYAPASEHSRTTGAGAGINDND